MINKITVETRDSGLNRTGIDVKTYSRNEQTSWHSEIGQKKMYKFFATLAQLSAEKDLYPFLPDVKQDRISRAHDLKVHIDNTNGLCSVRMSFCAKYTDNNGIKHKILTKYNDEELRDKIHFIIPLEQLKKIFLENLERDLC